MKQASATTTSPRFPEPATPARGRGREQLYEASSCPVQLAPWLLAERNHCRHLAAFATQLALRISSQVTPDRRPSRLFELLQTTAVLLCRFRVRTFRRRGLLCLVARNRVTRRPSLSSFSSSFPRFCMSVGCSPRLLGFDS